MLSAKQEQRSCIDSLGGGFDEHEKSHASPMDRCRRIDGSAACVLDRLAPVVVKLLHLPKRNSSKPGVRSTQPILDL